VRKVVVGIVLAILLLAGSVFIVRVPAETLLWRFLGVGSHDEVACPQDAVVVLGGGYYSTTDRLNGESTLRVLRGVQVFNDCGARWLVMSGRSAYEPKGRHAELMRDLAVRAGVPRERILLEKDSTNTREHPLFLRAMGLLDAQSRLAVVTSSWHLRRALIEFRRYFPRAVPVASYSFSPELADMLVIWLPQLRPLDRTTMLHEYGGILWYGVLRWYPALNSAIRHSD